MPKKEAKKLGRPPLPKGKAKGVITPIRFQPEDRAQFEKAAKRAKLSLSEWIRQTLKDAVTE
jgi:predicted HicB family RNase H-like nuclease